MLFSQSIFCSNELKFSIHFNPFSFAGLGKKKLYVKHIEKKIIYVEKKLICQETFDRIIREKKSLHKFVPNN